LPAPSPFLGRLEIGPGALGRGWGIRRKKGGY
jgi:hypothetical protein